MAVLWPVLPQHEAELGSGCTPTIPSFHWKHVWPLISPEPLTVSVLVRAVNHAGQEQMTEGSPGENDSLKTT